jgi:hypothetical protein
LKTWAAPCWMGVPLMVTAWMPLPSSSTMRRNFW